MASPDDLVDLAVGHFVIEVVNLFLFGIAAVAFPA
jgi:hypothetical protein